jgi:enamidase
MDRAQNSPGAHILASIAQGNLPGVAMTIIDGVIRSERSRNTPPASRVPTVRQQA